MNIKVYDDAQKAYLIIVYYKTLTTRYKYAHTMEGLKGLIEALNKNKNVCDYVIFKRQVIDYE